MKEVWKDVKRYEGRYQISNLGDVLSYCSGRPKLLKPIPNTKGYMSVNLCINGASKIYRINRLVAIAFIPNPENKPEVNHKDTDKTNNFEVNLEWCTSSENKQHAIKNGIFKVSHGGKHYLSTLNDLDVYWIKLWLSLKIQHKIIAKLFKVSVGVIANISCNRNWKHINLEDVVK